MLSFGSTNDVLSCLLELDSPKCEIGLGGARLSIRYLDVFGGENGVPQQYLNLFLCEDLNLFII